MSKGGVVDYANAGYITDQDAVAETYKACPECPDGGVWNMNGPTGATCPTCKGYAMVKLNGAALTKAEWDSL